MNRQQPAMVERTNEWPLHLLASPVDGDALAVKDRKLVSVGGKAEFPIDDQGLPLFAEQPSSPESEFQRAHYDRIADIYITNLNYPHTQEYLAFLDRVLIDVIPSGSLGNVAEICCGRGEAFELFKDRIGTGVGVDISPAMLHAARREHPEPNLFFCQGDATRLPLKSGAFDTVFMLGGIHHVNDREALFSEISRILKPGGTFFYREPVSDFFLWRGLRAIIYRLSPTLDHETERPLRHRETVPVLEKAGMASSHWSTHGFLGFCLFMNSDVLIFNRLFRFVPGIRSITRSAIALDEWSVRLPGMQGAGLQVIGAATKK